ncbi:MAG: LysM peptidoglycan-binding domain-containing protein [Candidatus Zixiibacteriota bacterium]|nr:MAG: LysM peptidoglycan-binding domain-containing protein [candidate division Zixibacteria bacterium]
MDDDIWRQFDLADDYQSMGVIANREASWEEAQYYFEKALSILANLDIETDSSLTPEAVRYNTLLENILAGYRVTMRSLGQLTDDVNPSVILDRFSDLETQLEGDTLRVYNQETKRITYDLPVIMNDRVKASIIYFQTVARDAFRKYLSRKPRYERRFREILRKHGLPEDLIYLSMVESGYNPHAYSWARAMGLWQFISSTGRLYGLKRDWWIDERKDPLKATEAAARFLKDLYNRFGNWELAMAAYNGGPGRVSRAIKRQHTRDFWKLRLRRQTMDYVPLIYAACIIGKDPEKYGFTDIDYEDEVRWEETTIDRCLDLKDIAREVGCSLKELKQLNPELLRNYTPPNRKKYTLRLPVGKKARFLAVYDKLPSPKETSWVKHRIRRGETVSSIAAKYGVSQYAIMNANNLGRRARIIAGKTLIVPVPLDREYARLNRRHHKYQAESGVYTVRSGDTMWDIARAFGTTVDALRRINSINRGSRIYVGQRLKIPTNARYLAKRNVKSSKSRSSSRKSFARTKPTRNNGSSHRSGKGKSGKYTVRAGDTLWDIARAHGMSTAQLRRLNGLGRTSRIYPGQVLTVNAADYIVYRVRRGDTLTRIARKYRTSVSSILAANNMVDPDNLRVGDRLKIYTR